MRSTGRSSRNRRIQCDTKAIPYHHHIAERPKKAQTPQLHDARWEYPSVVILSLLPAIQRSRDPVQRPYIQYVSFRFRKLQLTSWFSSAQSVKRQLPLKFIALAAIKDIFLFLPSFFFWLSSLWPKSIHFDLISWLAAGGTEMHNWIIKLELVFG